MEHSQWEIRLRGVALIQNLIQVRKTKERELKFQLPSSTTFFDKKDGIFHRCLVNLLWPKTKLISVVVPMKMIRN